MSLTFNKYLISAYVLCLQCPLLAIFVEQSRRFCYGVFFATRSFEYSSLRYSLVAKLYRSEISPQYLAVSSPEWVTTFQNMIREYVLIKSFGWRGRNDREQEPNRGCRLDIRNNFLSILQACEILKRDLICIMNFNFFFSVPTLTCLMLHILFACVLLSSDYSCLFFFPRSSSLSYL